MDRLKLIIKNNEVLYCLARRIAKNLRIFLIAINFFVRLIKNKLNNKQTYYFYFHDPLMYFYYKDILNEAFNSSKYCSYIIFSGGRTSYGENREEMIVMDEKYRCIFLSELPIRLAFCDALFTPNPKLVSKLIKGKIIELPHLSQTAMLECAKLFANEKKWNINNLEKTLKSITSKLKTSLTYTLTNDNTNDLSRKKIVIFSQVPTLWLSAQSVYEALVEDPRANVEIIQMPFYQKNYKQYHNMGDFLKRKGIPFRYWYNYDLNGEKPDVIIYLSPYDSTRPEEFQFDHVSKTEVKTVYIHYALEVSGGFILDYFFNLPIDRHAWRIFVRSERYKKLFDKYCSTGSDHVVVSGHPKMDMVFNLDKVQISDRLIENIRGRKVILWNPHHLVEENLWSTFVDWNQEILDIMDNYKNLFLILRPHPLLFGNLRKTKAGTSILEKFLDRAAKMENVQIDLTDNYLQSFKVSDALMSDASSLLLEYFPTKKPILYLPKVNTEGLNDDGEELVKLFYVGEEKQELNNFMDMVVRGKDPMKEIRISKIDEFLYKVDGNVGNRIKEYLLN